MAYGDGSRISFWFDTWSTVCPLIESFSAEDVERSKVDEGVTIKDLFTSEAWTCCLMGSYGRLHMHKVAFFDRISAMVPLHMQPSSGLQDRVVWKLCQDEIFTIVSAWSHFRSSSQRVNQATFVWAKGILPIISFILWLVMMDRIRTTDFLFMLGIWYIWTCSICGRRRETIDHIFFLCSYSRKVWSLTLALIVLPNFLVTWSVIRGLVFSYAGHHFRRLRKFGKLLGTTMYCI